LIALADERHPADQPTAADRHEQHVRGRRVLEDFQRDRRRAGDDVGSLYGEMNSAPRARRTPSPCVPPRRNRALRPAASAPWRSIAASFVFGASPA
jgi:hypothetical protein